MGAFSIWHIVVIAIVAAFLFFGWKQLPDMARSFGRSLRVFKTEIKGLTDDDAARDKARDDRARDSDVAESRQVEAAKPERPAAAAPEPRVAPRAEMVRNSAGPRPRPTPNPNGRPRT